MKIAFVNPEYPPLSGFGHGGIASFIYTMASALSSMGHHVHILLRDGTVPDALPSEITIHYYKFEQRHGQFRYIDRFFRDGTVVWEQGNARSIYSILNRIWITDGLDAVEFADYLGLAHETRSAPFGHCIHFQTPQEIVDELNQTLITSSRKRRHAFERRALFTTSVYRSSSEALKEIMCRRYGILHDQVTVLRNPIDTMIYDTIEKKHAFEKRIDILFVGRLERRKGAELIQRSIKRILHLDPAVNVTFAGETELGDALSYRNAIERSLDENERGRVWFIGPVRHEELPPLYCRSSVLFMPSLFDNAPLTLLEAMAAKLPVVASDTGGINEIIHNGRTGLLFRPGDIESMLDCFSTLIKNKETAFTMAENAYTDVRTTHSPQTIAEQSLRLYESIVKKRE